jgi:hypothetical protein
MIKGQKVWIYSRPDCSAKTPSYVMHGDSVAVTDRRGSWLHVDTLEVRRGQRADGYRMTVCILYCRKSTEWKVVADLAQSQITVLFRTQEDECLAI